MLDSLRAFSRTWVAKIFLGVLILSFAVFGISNVITDVGNSSVARVGSEDITVREFQRAYQTQLNAAAQQIGSVPTTEQALALGIPGAVLGQLSADAAVSQVGSELGLGVSEARLAKMLREDPSFAGTLGSFERDNFLRVLQQSGYTEAEYFTLQTRAARRQQLAAGLFADAAVPQAAAELVSRYQGDTRTIEYFVLNDAALLPNAEPTEEELAAYLAENQADYRTTEVRTVDILSLSPETIAATKTIAEDVLREEYERTQASLTQPERRTIRQVVLADEAVRAAFEAGAAAGRSFDELVAETGAGVTELGTFAPSEVTDPALGAAAFELAEGSFVIIPGVAGQRAVSVSAIEPGGVSSFEEVREDIANRLALAEARNEYIDLLDQIEELRAAFQPLADIGARFDLPVETINVGAEGLELAAIADLPASERRRVATAIFAAAPERLAPTVTLSTNRNVWFDVKSIEAARDRTLDEARDEILLAIDAERTDAALQAEVARVLAQLEAGQPFSDVAITLSQFPSLSQPMTRQGDGTPIIDARIAAAAFAGGEGHYGSAQNGQGDYVVFQVQDVTAPEGINAQATTLVEEATRDSLFSDFVTAVRDEYGVRENRTVLNQLLALDTTAQ